MLRRQVLERFNNKCVISNIDEDLLLEVAHIKPVSKCDNIHEKADINNVLLLWINIHKYFDNYKLTINPQTSKVEVTLKNKLLNNLFLRLSKQKIINYFLFALNVII